jgi:hypothetical protein
MLPYIGDGIDSENPLSHWERGRGEGNSLKRKRFSPPPRPSTTIEGREVAATLSRNAAVQ